MRIGIFTGTFIVILTAVLIYGELTLKENRTAMRAYSGFSDAVETALDDACEYLSLVAGEGKELNSSGAEYIENIYIEALASALGKEPAVFGGSVKQMTAVFVVSDGCGNVFLRNTRLDGAWKKVENLKDPDDAAQEISRFMEAGAGTSTGKNSIFLPDKTGLTGYKAAENMSVLACMICRLGRGLSGNRDFVCVRNAQVRRIQPFTGTCEKEKPAEGAADFSYGYLKRTKG